MHIWHLVKITCVTTVLFSIIKYDLGMDQYHRAEEEDELTEMVCQETELKDGQWVCSYWTNVGT